MLEGDHVATKSQTKEEARFHPWASDGVLFTETHNQGLLSAVSAPEKQK